MKNNFKQIFLTIISIAILFILLVFSKNSNTLIVDMKSPTIQVLDPQIYFTKTNQAFSEEKSRKPFQNKQGQYAFSLPTLKSINHIRFDPAKKPTRISISKIVLTQNKWFNKTVYVLPLASLTPTQHIKDYKKQKNLITFTSTSNDPQCNANFRLNKISTTHTIHFNLLLISIISYSLLHYLIYLYKTEPLNDYLTAKIMIYMLFIAFAFFKVDYYKEHIKKFYPPDELAHLAYIHYIHTHDLIIPKFEDMRMLNNKKAGNYLNHPPLYYHLMNIVYDKNQPIYNTVDTFRTINMTMFMISFLLILYLGFSFKTSILSHFSYLTVVSSVPMFAYSGGSITNDNLAILGAIVFIIALKRMIENHYNSSTFFILGLGIFLAYFSKLTVAILLFFALLFFLLYAIKVKSEFRITKVQMIMLAVFMLPIIYYQSYIFYHYHSLMPSFHITYPEQFLKSVFFIPEEHRQHLTQLEWLERMKDYIIGGWFGIHSHHSFVKNSLIEYVGLFLLHLFALFMLFVKCSQDTRSYCIIGKIALLSLISVLIVQYTFSYQTHINNGYMGGLQPRYLLPFMFSFAIMTSLFIERYKHYFLFNIVIIVICINALYSDFFYFLKYYI